MADGLAIRFQRKVCKAGPTPVHAPNLGPCWIWTGKRRRHGGHGVISLCDGTGRCVRAHRVAWALAYGTTPASACVCHKCDNPACVNPKHLFLGTQRANVHDMLSKGRGRLPPKPARGAQNVNARMIDDVVQDIRRLYAEGCTQQELADRFGVSQSTVSRTVLRQTWTHI